MLQAAVGPQEFFCWGTKRKIAAATAINVRVLVSTTFMLVIIK